ncbi:peptidase S8/S53 domain-containing protein [Lineolata rhizophorae]|uniref:Peptidase S8/S53 domain-containing protein n=1 Tax=Lineolata rhizophorae TaxID=578093 RepID=A0A6A6P718_9PEZI|nr:peptidase S8/S53 domain-containing protein [Lineolata rhizophorae]
MRAATLWTLAALATSALCRSSALLRPRDYHLHDYYAVHLDARTTTPDALAAHLGLEYEGGLGELPDHHIFRAAKRDGHDVLEHAVRELEERRRRRRKRDALNARGASAAEEEEELSPLDGILFRQKQKLKPRMWKRGVIPSPPDDSARAARQLQGPPPDDAAIAKHKELAEELGIEDPIFLDQWHLYNNREPGNDLNVTGLWKDGVTGANTTVCIVDDGLDFDSLDLAPNYLSAGSYDFNDKVDDPKPRLSDDRHGTRCAGEVAAAKNDVCGVGVAYEANIAGIRILSKPITDADEAVAMNYEMQVNEIYSCSWGPPDDGRSMDAPGILIRRAFVNAIQNGREGKGTIYVFAAGNGANNDDNCNFDGYTNSIYSVTVGAIDRENNHPYYSEKCSAQLVVTYSSGRSDNIHTTDVGENKCTVSHGGTSAAGPLVAGVYALVLQVRPELTWRDVQWLSVLNAVPLDQESDWQETGLGVKFSHQFGYGKVDAWALVEAARDWELVKPQAWFFSPWMHVRHAIPQGDQGLASSFDVTEEMLAGANLARLEHVTVTMNVEHSRRGDLSVELRSPSGVVSHLATARRNDDAAAGYADWTFMSVAHWGEAGAGRWTVVVKDAKVNEHEGSFTDWKLRLWGECRDPDAQPLLPMPAEHDDDDHDVVTSAPVATTSLSASPAEETGEPAPLPSDHPHRPINSKPTGTAAAAAAPTAATSSATGAPAASASAAPPESFLPSPFPTFGVSKRTQIWIYGALGLILVFCAGLCAYLAVWRRRRRRLGDVARDDYEFEVLEEDEDEDEDEGGDEGEEGGGEGERGGLMKGGRRGARRKRRAGELYDAFAGESDEDGLEGEEFYRDEVAEGSEGEERRREAAGYDEKDALRGEAGGSSGDDGRLSSGSGSGPGR